MRSGQWNRRCRTSNPIRVKLDAARAAYHAEMRKFNAEVIDSLLKAETAARARGDKAAVDRLKLERLAMELQDVAPKSLPAAQLNRPWPGDAPLDGR